LLNDKRTEVNKAAENEPTPLWYAAYLGDTEIVRLLLNEKAIDPNPMTTSCAPLFIAATQGFLEIVGLLLDAPGIKPNLESFEGETALSIAAINNHQAVVQFLLRNEGIDPNHANKAGNTALMTAAAMSNKEMVAILLARENIDPNRKDNIGATALFFAAKQHSEAIIVALMRKGALATKVHDPLCQRIIVSAIGRADLEVLIEPACFTSRLAVQKSTPPGTNEFDQRKQHASSLVASLCKLPEQEFCLRLTAIAHASIENSTFSLKDSTDLDNLFSMEQFSETDGSVKRVCGTILAQLSYLERIGGLSVLQGDPARLPALTRQILEKLGWQSTPL
jgi:ankyrin repeat protein